MKKLYSNDLRDGARTLADWRSYMIWQDIDQLELKVHVIDNNTDYMYCIEFDEVGESGNCGKQCEKYKPRNGKNGVCTHHRRCYEETDEYFNLTIQEKQND